MKTYTASSTPPALRSIELLAKLMDNQFRIPGTQIRFGLDPIIGLIPGGGDFAGFLVAAYMLSVLAKNGASGFVLARMVLNIVLDAVLGSIPLVGDVFDFAFKANQRNLQLMREHYQEGRHRGGAWKLLVPLLLVLLIFLVGLVWLSYKFISWIAGWG
ncbi:MAG: DUF4112 domain-containing protein [Chitinophagaceae bacterium]|nr:DUF4112 domain-containing protein [Chitinophagaceae bacterium]